MESKILSAVSLVIFGPSFGRNLVLPYSANKLFSHLNFSCRSINEKSKIPLVTVSLSPLSSALGESAYSSEFFTSVEVNSKPAFFKTADQP